jgi:hypothetical protein
VPERETRVLACHERAEGDGNHVVRERAVGGEARVLFRKMVYKKFGRKPFS